MLYHTYALTAVPAKVLPLMKSYEIKQQEYYILTRGLKDQQTYC